jgi:hypothetical protein
MGIEPMVRVLQTLVLPLGGASIVRLIIWCFNYTIRIQVGTRFELTALCLAGGIDYLM